MADNVPMIVAMAERCEALLLNRSAARIEGAPDQPEHLRARHLVWMCREIARHSGEWSEAKVQRWLGFVQGAMIATDVIGLRDAKTMFEAERSEHGKPDQDLLDHLDPGHAFEIELGGQG